MNVGENPKSIRVWIASTEENRNQRFASSTGKRLSARGKRTAKPSSRTAMLPEVVRAGECQDRAANFPAFLIKTNHLRLACLIHASSQALFDPLALRANTFENRGFTGRDEITPGLF